MVSQSYAEWSIGNYSYRKTHCSNFYVFLLLNNSIMAMTIITFPFLICLLYTVIVECLQVDSKQRITVRNLRIREDTAKYLRNLDPNSAYYDPKTRSMRDNPDPALAE